MNKVTVSGWSLWKLWDMKEYSCVRHSSCIGQASALPHSIIGTPHDLKAVSGAKPECILALVAAVCLAGCASVHEKTLRDKYSETASKTYEVADARAAFNAHTNLDGYLRYAFVHNSMIHAAFNRWQAAIERIPQARSLDDPSLSFEYFIEQRTELYQVSLSQTFPALGKVELRDKVAEAEAEAAMHEFEEKRVILYDRVAKAFYEYYYLSRAILVTGESLRLLSDVDDVLVARYKAGLAPFSELIKVQVEKDRLTNELATMRDERGPKSTMLQSLLNLPAGEALPWPEFTTSGQSIIDEAVLAGMIQDLNPELKAAEAMIAAAEEREKLARRSFLPDFTLGANWVVMPGVDGKGNESDVSLMAGITLPLWWGKYHSEMREAAAMAKSASNERDDKRNMLRADLSMSVFKFRDAERKTALFKAALIPKATQALEVARQEFSSGQADFMTLIDAHRALLELKLQDERAAVEREIAIAEIGCCIGKYGSAIGGSGRMTVEKR